jgi:F0F1-type ATP synthase assembly protein I
VIARSYARRKQHRAAVVSRVVGMVFAVAFAGIANGAGSSATSGLKACTRLGGR